MTIKYVKGDLLSVQEGIIIHGCNAQGVMGDGVAKAIRDKYPMVYDVYREDYKFRNEFVELGTYSSCWVSSNLLIINAITQNTFGHNSKIYVNYAAIVKVFQKALSIAYIHYHKLHFPKIGTGLGGGNWGVIEQLLIDSDPENKVEKICWEL